MGVSGRTITNASSAHYAGLAASAGAFAQELDTIRGSAVATDLELQLIEDMSSALWANRNVDGQTPFQTPGTYEVQCRAVLAIVTACLAYYTAQGLSPNGSGGSAVIFFRPGMPTAAPCYETWSEVRDQINLSQGAITVIIVTLFGTATATGSTDCQGLTTFRPIQGIPDTSFSTTFTIADGAELIDPGEFCGNMMVEAHPTGTVDPITITEGLILRNGAFLRLLAGATRPFMRIAGEDVQTILCDQDGSFSTLAAQPVILLQGLAELILRITRCKLNQPATDTVAGAVGTTLTYTTDETVVLPATQTGMLGTIDRDLFFSGTVIAERNAAQIGPGAAGAAVAFTSSALDVQQSGLFEIHAGASVISSVPGEAITFQLLLQGVVITSSPAVIVNCDAVTGRAFCSLSWVTTTALAIGLSRTFAIQATPAAGTATIAASNGYILVKELPGAVTT
jgi:hypothetical protein